MRLGSSQLARPAKPPLVLGPLCAQPLSDTARIIAHLSNLVARHSGMHSVEGQFTRQAGDMGHLRNAKPHVPISTTPEVRIKLANFRDE